MYTMDFSEVKIILQRLLDNELAIKSVIPGWQTLDG